MTINNDIKLSLKDANIPVDDGLLYLVGLYYDLNVSFIPDNIASRVNRLNIVSVEEKEITWKVPLFYEQVTNYDWVAEWMDLFGNINPDRKGLKRTAIARMKKFFAENPEYSPEDVFAATRMYLDNLDNKEYVITSHYFIQKGAGVNKTEPLLDWCEKLKTSRESERLRRGSNTMR